MKKGNLHETTAYQLKPGLQMRQFGLDHGIYDHESKQIFMLNPIAGLILNYLFTGKSYDEIVENIEIACGKSEAKSSEIKNDLEKTVKEFIHLKLVEPIRASSYVLQDSLVISENEMTSLSIPYMPPNIKAYGMEELLNKYRRFNDKRFPDSGPVSFGDTWNPTQSTFIDVKFADTWDANAENRTFPDSRKTTEDKPRIPYRRKGGPERNKQ